MVNISDLIPVFLSSLEEHHSVDGVTPVPRATTPAVCGTKPTSTSRDSARYIGAALIDPPHRREVQRSLESSAPDVNADRSVQAPSHRDRYPVGVLTVGISLTEPVDLA